MIQPMNTSTFAPLKLIHESSGSWAVYLEDPHDPDHSFVVLNRYPTESDARMVIEFSQELLQSNLAQWLRNNLGKGDGGNHVE